jgi:hypothetical protein
MGHTAILLESFPEESAEVVLETLDITSTALASSTEAGHGTLQIQLMEGAPSAKLLMHLVIL